MHSGWVTAAIGYTSLNIIIDGGHGRVARAPWMQEHHSGLNSMPGDVRGGETFKEEGYGHVLFIDIAINDTPSVIQELLTPEETCNLSNAPTMRQMMGTFVILSASDIEEQVQHRKQSYLCKSCHNFPKMEPSCRRHQEQNRRGRVGIILTDCRRWKKSKEMSVMVRGGAIIIRCYWTEQTLYLVWWPTRLATTAAGNPGRLVDGVNTIEMLLTLVKANTEAGYPSVSTEDEGRDPDYISLACLGTRQRFRCGGVLDDHI
eukprot:Gb_15779 [translate_table: standard]